MQRRDFLVRTGLAFGAVAFARAPIAAATQAAAPSRHGSDDWDALRSQFLLTRDLIHMAGFYLASHPTPVREAIERHRKALDENTFEAHRLHVAGHEVRTLQSAADYLGVAPIDIALTDSTTMGLGLLYSSLVLRPDQEILSTTHDHFATNTALKFRARRTGATVRNVALYDRGADASEAEIVARIAKAITAQTRFVAITWVHSGTGVKLPIRAIADTIALANKSRSEQDRIYLCVDGVHGIGIENVTLPQLGCDFFIAGCHKWLFGPRGTGFVWASPMAWELTAPTIPPFLPHSTDVNFNEVIKGDSTRDVDGPALTGPFMTPGGFHSFEHRWALAEAFELHGQIGKARIEERIHALNLQMKEGLVRMSHVTLHTPTSTDLSAGIVCFEVAGMTPTEAIERLRKKNIVASVTPYDVKYARVAPSLLNSPAEVDVVLREIKALA